jgi:AcrR family transcriptional regulator
MVMGRAAQFAGAAIATADAWHHVNKNGQLLGRKGMETRKRLMAAAQRLLAERSPFELTALLITREAKAAPATFYVYFDDVQDVLYAMSAEIASEIVDLFDGDRLLRDPDRFFADGIRFVRAFNEVWDRHSDILLYRNLEADRGNPRFNALRTEGAIPVMNALADRIAKAYPPDRRPRRGAVYAEAAVFFVALERLAAAVHQYPEDGLSTDDLMEAQARILARLLEPR